jgi:hypothetical protein
MEFAQDVADYGDAHLLFADGVSRITKASSGVVMITFYELRETTADNIEKRVCAVVRCPAEIIGVLAAQFAAAAPVVERAAIDQRARELRLAH